MIKCLIFDCDGTLVDSELICNLGLEIQLREYNIETSANDMMKKYRGGKLAEILKSIEEEHNIVLKDNFVKNYRELIELLFEKKLTACEGVNEMLQNIDLPICVASSGPTKKINKALSITGLKKYFNENIYSSYEINSWKPDPEIFLHAAKEMGFYPNECLVIEDSMKGIQAGLAANMKTVLYDPMYVHENIEGVYKINGMNELKDIISTHNNG